MGGRRAGGLTCVLAMACLNFQHVSGGWTFAYPPEVVIVTNDTWNTQIEPDTSRRWVLDFYAPWCPHCRDFAPIFGEVAVQLKTKQAEIRFGAVDCEANKDLCQLRNISGFPTTRMYKGAAVIYETVGEENMTEYGMKLRDELAVENMTGLSSMIDANAHVTLTPQMPKLVRWPLDQCKRVAAADIAFAVFFGLKEGVYLQDKPLDTDRAAALADWAAVLNATLPAGSHNLFALLAWLKEHPAPEQAGLTAQVAKLSIFGNGPTVKAAACDGAEHGYSCSLWLVFHTVLQATRTDAEAVAAMTSIQRYVAHFFGCQSCQTHFAAVTKDFQVKMKTRQQIVLFLWSVHNLVSERLAAPHGYVNDPTFPPATICPDCRSGGSYKQQNLQWNEADVYAFLLSTYCLPGQSCVGGSGGDEPAEVTVTNGGIPISKVLTPAAIIGAIVVLIGVSLVGYRHYVVQPNGGGYAPIDRGTNLPARGHTTQPVYGST